MEEVRPLEAKDPRALASVLRKNTAERISGYR